MKENKCPYIPNDDCGYPCKDRSDSICHSDFYKDCYSFRCLEELKKAAKKEETEADADNNK